MLWQVSPILHHSPQNMSSVAKLFGAEEEEVIFNVRGFESHKKLSPFSQNSFEQFAENPLWGLENIIQGLKE